jgi:hypothetical protein
LGRDKQVGGTVLGELRVSGFLLGQLANARIESFRSGHLAYPPTLPQALRATGYRNSSSMTANAASTHLPFQLTYDRAGDALEPVYEFPVTLEDELGERLGDRVDAANRTLEAIARNGGIAVVLVHPNITDHKLVFVERVVDAWKSRAWIGTLAQLGAWWRARDGVRIDVAVRQGRRYLEVESAEPVAGLVVYVPKAQVKRVTVSMAPGRATYPLD